MTRQFLDASNMQCHFFVPIVSRLIKGCDTDENAHVRGKIGIMGVTWIGYLYTTHYNALPFTVVVGLRVTGC